MARHSTTAGKAKGWALMLLAWLAVLVPVWGSLYECPMTRSEPSAEVVCCAPATHLPAPSASAVPWFDVGCDCPQLDWQELPAEAARELRSDSVHPFPLVFLRSLQTPRQPQPDQFLPRVHVSSRSSGPPLWVLHQSIRC